ncbi:MAG: DUF115 domain-containing protein [Brevinematales bacterium]|nr:DUF115 domain-containing protein [Brevinematales bacterium]
MIEIVKGLNGLLTVKKDGVFLLSSYDPLKEINKFINNLQVKEDEFLILFGLGLGYLSKELSKRYKVYAFLPFPEEKEFLTENVLEINSYNILQIIEKELVNGKKPRLISLESYKKYFQNEYSEFEKMLILNTKLAVENIKVSSFFIKVWFFNFLRNIYIGLKRKYRFFVSVNEKTDKDVLICAAGPSLNENIDFIKDNRDKFIIISVLSAYKTLNYFGIKPDIIFVTDGGVANSFYFDDFPEGVVIFADIYSSSSFLSKVKNDVVFINFLDEIENPSFMLCDPSVSVSAGKWASKITNGKVIFSGFDLAYSKIYGSHSFPNSFTNPFFKKFNRFFRLENYLFGFLKRNDLHFSDKITNKQFQLLVENIKNEFKNFYCLPNKTGIEFLNPIDKINFNSSYYSLTTLSLSERKLEINKLLNKLEKKEEIDKILIKEKTKKIDIEQDKLYKKIQFLIDKIRRQIRD